VLQNIVKIVLALILIGLTVLFLHYSSKDKITLDWLYKKSGNKYDIMKPDTDIHDAVNFVK